MSGAGGREVGDSARHDGAEMFREVIERPIPPGSRQEPGDIGLAEAFPDEPGRITAGDAVIGHVTGDDRTSADDRTVTDPDPGHHRDTVTEPDVVADHGVAAVREIGDQVEML